MYRHFLLLFSLAACAGTPNKDAGDSDSDAISAELITCEVLEDPGFCWTSAVEEVYGCFATADNESGVMSADGGTCTFDDGTSIRFDNPPPEFGSDDTWAFTVLDPTGGECAKYVETATDTEAGYSLTVDSGVYDAVASLTYTINCADGTVYETGDILSLFECDFTKVPGFASTGTVDAPNLSIWPVPDGESTMFSCAPAE